MKGVKQPYLSSWLNDGQDKNNRPRRGYTIVEVMVFLAVSGIMFIVAASFISGKQGKSEFRQGMNAINAQVQQVITDVSNGYYLHTSQIFPHISNFSCTATSPGPPQLVATHSTEPGTNHDCVFLGKVMQFQADRKGPYDTPTDSYTLSDNTANNYNIFTVVGRQSDTTTNNPPANFTQSQPIAAYNPVNLTEYNTLEWGLEVTKMYEDNGTQSIFSAVGFFSSFSGLTTESGSQTVTAAAIPTIPAGQTPSAAAGIIGNSATLNALDNPDNINPKIVICFKSSSTTQYGSLTIGGGATNGIATGQRLATNIQISDSPIAGCPGP